MRAIVVEKGRFEPALHTVEEKEIDRKRVGKWSEKNDCFNQVKVWQCLVKLETLVKLLLEQ